MNRRTSSQPPESRAASAAFVHFGAKTFTAYTSDFSEVAFLATSGRTLEKPAAEHQSHHRDREHDQAEVAALVGAREHAEARAEQRDRQHAPVAPAEERDLRMDREQQSDKADQDRDQVVFV